MKIQQVEKQTGLQAQSIRFYEREGLILPQRNPENRYRTYSQEDVQRLETIVFCRKLGIPISKIRKLLAEQVSLRECVEDALLDARAAEQEARAVAELCETVLLQLETCPDLTAMACTQLVLGAPRVRYLYEQVVPQEQRKVKKRFQIFHLMYILGIATVIMGLICAGMIVHIAATRSGRADLYQWVGDPANELTLVYGDLTCSVTENPELNRKLSYMLLLGQPPQFVPGLRPAEKIVHLLVDGPQGQGKLSLYLQEDSVGMIWKSPTGSFRATLMQHQAWVQLTGIIRTLETMEKEIG